MDSPPIWMVLALATAGAGAGQARPAPPLTSVRILSVSSAAGSESIQPGQLVTLESHAGTELAIVTEDLGFGSNPIASYNHQALAQAQQVPIQDSTRGVIGFRRLYRYSGAYTTGGLLVYQNTSTNAPGTTLTAHLRIR